MSSGNDYVLPQIFEDAVRPPWDGVRQDTFQSWPGLKELFPAGGGGMPGLEYVLVHADHLNEYLNLNDDGEADAPIETRWLWARGRETFFTIQGESVAVLARGKPLLTKEQGDFIAPLYVDRRLRVKIDGPAETETAKAASTSSGSGKGGSARRALKD